MKQININSVVVYKEPLEDEKGITFTVIEIERHTNWCLIQANVDMVFKPVETANISDLEIVETTQFTAESAAKLFGVSVAVIKKQYLDNARGLRLMYKKAKKTGKKVGGATAEELKANTIKYYNLAL